MPMSSLVRVMRQLEEWDSGFLVGWFTGKTDHSPSTPDMDSFYDALLVYWESHEDSKKRAHDMVLYLDEVWESARTQR